MGKKSLEEVYEKIKQKRARQQKLQALKERAKYHQIKTKRKVTELNERAQPQAKKIAKGFSKLNKGFQKVAKEVGTPSKTAKKTTSQQRSRNELVIGTSGLDETITGGWGSLFGSGQSNNTQRQKKQKPKLKKQKIFYYE